MTKPLPHHPVIAIQELPEDNWLMDSNRPIDPRRTRDDRYYRETFGVNGFCVAYIRRPGRHLVTADNLEDILVNSGCRAFGIGALMGQNDEKGGLMRDSRAKLETVNAIARRHPHVLSVGIWGESETHSYRKLSSSATPCEAYAHYRRLLLLDPVPTAALRQAVERLLETKPQVTVRDVLSVVLGVPLDPAIEIHTCPDKVYGIHPHFAMGADLVHMERSGWNGNGNLAIAFLRGGAYEFGKKWALNMSPWGNSHSYARAGTAYDGNNRHVAGNSAELHWFTNLSALLAGADMILHAGNETMFFRLPEPTRFGPPNCDHGATDCGRQRDPGEFGAPLTPVGAYAQRLARLLKNPQFDRGTPVLSAALMVELWHGWESHHFACEDWAWAGKVPVHRGDRMMSALFDLFFPGHSLAGRAHDRTYNSDVPFESEFEMMRMLYAGMDMRPYEKGIFVPTPLGDALDVITDQIEPERLRRYPVVILAGRLSLTPENLPRLRDYVEDGGTLVLHGMGLGLWDGERGLDLPPNYAAEVESLIGGRIKNLFSIGHYPSVSCATGARFLEGKYEYTLIEPVSATPLMEGEEIYEALNRERNAQALSAIERGEHAGHPRENKELNRIMRERREAYRYQTGNGTPLVTENRVGSGRVIFCAPHHHLTASARQWVHGVRQALLDVLDTVVPVEIHGKPIQFHVNRTDQGYLIGLFNWSEHPWNGHVELRTVKAIRSVTRLVEDTMDGCQSVVSSNRFSATVSPYGVELFQLETDGRDD